jgi:hypothetical protein
MNINGNPSTLVAPHPGNTNAVKHGVHSSRFIEPRAAEIVTHLTETFEFSVAERIVVEQLARCIAILDALDRDLDERGLVDKRGEPRYLLNYRSRITRDLERWLSKVTPTIERQTAEREAVAHDGPPEYDAELRRIASGHDTTATARDVVSASRELRSIDSERKNDITVVQLHIPGDRMPPRLRSTAPEDEVLTPNPPDTSSRHE